MIFIPDNQVSRQHSDFPLLRKRGILDITGQLEVFLGVKAIQRIFKVVKVAKEANWIKNRAVVQMTCLSRSLGGGAVMNNEIAKAQKRMSLGMRWGSEKQVWMSQ